MVPAAVPQLVPAVVAHVVPAVVPHRVPAAVPHMVPAVVPQMVPRSAAGCRTVEGTGCSCSPITSYLSAITSYRRQTARL